MTDNQTTQILGYLKRNGSIDPMQALRLFGSFRLAARIQELKGTGHRISKQMVQNRQGKRFARYSLKDASAA